MRRKSLVGVAALMLLAGCGESSEPKAVTPPVTVSDAEARAAANAAASTATTTAQTDPATKWRYDSSKDEMRGTVAHFAVISSENVINLGFPYDPETAQLTLRKRPSDGLSVILRAPGQFLCRSYDDDTVAVKFDDGPIQQFTCAEPDDSATGVLFINSEARFIERLKKAKRVIIEAQMYQAGGQQMTFDVTGLDWPPKG